MQFIGENIRRLFVFTNVASNYFFFCYPIMQKAFYFSSIRLFNSLKDFIKMYKKMFRETWNIMLKNTLNFYKLNWFISYKMI